ncbi:ADP-ribosylglycohydrolase family protein [Lindgomyces ingoldianus]|uniref:ADP-ribosylglycohydrolase family protein n=1 Tax=Lindgomyces ingoldianus TaxID=673940 RepID=A0ACB6RDA1_9PLEO|nr:ADP-ribosylglycohydrolase family protein [Lindgomyces ingoldianus]KAF2476302.1 ADP-ribosylglycohydrolase family protein [Lindgomyces ingoldianus]
MPSTPNSHPTLLSKTLGALLGVHAGDSLGATLEFMPWEKIQSKYPNGHRIITGGGPFNWTPGHATDDTDLTRAVLLAYQDYIIWKTSSDFNSSEPPFDITKSAADYSLRWMQGNWPDREPGSGPQDIGNATWIGLSNYQSSGNARNCGAGNGKAGNGSLMRCIPSALFEESSARRKMESMEISAITHNDARCTVACAAYNEIVAAMVVGKTAREAVQIGQRVAEDLDCPAVVRAFEKGKETSVLKLAGWGPGNDFPDAMSGYVLESLTLAIAAVLDSRSFEDILVDVVRIGGDTDTNGAIAGGLLGARDGVEAIPKQWLEVLQFRKEFETVTRKILELQGRI